MLVIHQKRFLIKPRLIWTSSRWWVLLWKDYGWFLIELSIFDFSSNFTGPDLQKFSVFELSRSMLVIHQKRFLIKPRLIWTSSRWWVLLWKDYGWFLIELSIFDFSSNFTGPDLQKFSVFELLRSMLVINQKRFLIKPRLIWTSSRWWVLLWKDYGWFLIELSIFDFSSNFTGPDLQKFSVFELSRSMLVIHQKRFLIKPRLIWTSSRWWVLLWKDYGWFLIELSIFDFSSNFTGPDLQKFSVFELSRSMLVIHQKRFLIKPRLIWTSSRWWVLLWKDYGWFLIELSIFDFSSNFTGPDLQKFSVFELSRSMLVIQSKKVPNQAKIDLDFIKMVSITLEGLWMVSDRIVDFRFFLKFHRSGPAKIFSFWTITEHVSYQSKKVPNQAKIDLDFIKMVSITLEGLWMVSDRIVDFRFFVKFHRSGPAKIFSFWTITEHVSYQSKKVPNPAKNWSGLHQDGEYYSGRIMDGFW